MKKLFPLFFVVYAGVCFYTLWKYQMFTSVMSRMALCWLAGALVMTILFFVGKRRGRYDVVDAGWGLSFIATAVTGFFLQDGHKLRWDSQALTTLLVIIWGSRLAWHITQRIRRTDHEDERYVALRKKWRGNLAVNTFFRIYMLQTVLALIVSIPVVHINLVQDPAWSWWVYGGTTLWLIGFVIEVIADRQLAEFLSQPKNKGKLMDKGLWRYARYPNYFGELTMWWAIAIISFGTPHGWVGTGGAAVITYLIVYVSGIPLKEARLRTRAGWQEHRARTHLLIPVPK